MTTFNATVFDSQKSVSSRILTREGFLQGKAALTRVGILEYDAAELGVGSLGQKVRVMQTPASVFHKDTIASAQSATLTLSHPKAFDGSYEDVRPETYRRETVGNVFGTPSKVGDALESDIIVKDANAISVVNDGMDGLSIGKEFMFNRAKGTNEYDYITEGPILFNHVGIVPREKARAGETVRIYDEKPEEADMTLTAVDIKNAVIEGMTASMPSFKAAIGDSPEKVYTPADLSEDIKKAVADAVAAAVVPSQQRVEELAKEMADKQAVAEKAAREQQEAESAAKAENEAKESAAAFEAQIRAEERARALIVADVLPFIAEDKREELSKADTKEMLLAAVGDSVPNAAEQTEDYLRGILYAKKNSVPEQTSSSGTIATRQANVGDSSRGVSDLEKARLEYEEKMANAWKATPAN